MITNHVLNPGAEGATASLEAETTCVVAMVTTSATGWPSRGTKSYSLSPSATTASTARLRLVERAAATPGQRWHLRLRLRAATGNTGTRAVRGVLRFYSAAPGATAGSTLLDVPFTTTLAPAAIADVVVSGVAPASTLSAGFVVTRDAGSGAATTDVFHADDILLAQTADLVTPAYFEGGMHNAEWSGVEHASTSRYYVTTPVLTPEPDDNPGVEVRFDELLGATRSITLYRQDPAGVVGVVREAENAFAVGGYIATDYEAPLQTAVTYRAMQYDELGNELGYTDTASTTLNTPDGISYLTDPRRPAVFVAIEMTENAGSRPSNPIPARMHTVGDRRVALVGRRTGLVGLNMDFYTSTAVDRAAVDDIVGTANGLVLIRTPPPMPVPRLLYCFAGNIVPDEFPPPLEDVEWLNTVDELPAFVGGLAEAAVTWQDYIDAYATWADLQADYLRWVDMLDNPPEGA